jgi:hypothetical protein
MNWAVVRVGGSLSFATVYYIIWDRKTYTPPTETIEDFIERYQAAGTSVRKGGGQLSLWMRLRRLNT